MSDLVPAWRLRQEFALRLSTMYRREVPAYGTLLDLVESINDPAGCATAGARVRMGQERHGAVRVALPEELSLLRRALAILGMFPVGYYDLAPAGLPVHSTAFRPVNADEMERSPFRLFVSLVRLDQIQACALRTEAERLVRKRSIMAPSVVRSIERAEARGGLSPEEADCFLDGLMETFRWRGEALSDGPFYDALIDEHPLLADVACFPNPHINHLTPRVSDIDKAQKMIIAQGLPAKKVIEGPPRRQCPILLRQTAFRALEEPVVFRPASGTACTGMHTARFGEIEARGAALTPAGMALYSDALTTGKFDRLPDDWSELRSRGLVWFRYIRRTRNAVALSGNPDILEKLIADGDVVAEPMTYEDFLPVSAAGIFRSNLRSTAKSNTGASGSRHAFEAALGCRVIDAQTLYQKEQAISVQALSSDNQLQEAASHA